MTGMTARLVLARHGESTWNVEDRYQGHADSGLTSGGRAQAADLTEWLQTLPGGSPAIVASSDLARAYNTAQIYADRSGAVVRVDDRLRELDTGSWTGQRFSDIARLHPEAVGAAARGVDVRRGGGETFAELRSRVWSALCDLVGVMPVEPAPGGPPATLVVFTHGGPIRVAAAEALGLPTPGHAQLAPPPNCSVTILEVGEAGSRLVTYSAPTVPGARAARAE